MNTFDDFQRRIETIRNADFPTCTALTGVHELQRLVRFCILANGIAAHVTSEEDIRAVEVQIQSFLRTTGTTYERTGSFLYPRFNFMDSDGNVFAHACISYSFDTQKHVKLCVMEVLKGTRGVRSEIVSPHYDFVRDIFREKIFLFIQSAIPLIQQNWQIGMIEYSRHRRFYSTSSDQKTPIFHAERTSVPNIIDCDPRMQLLFGERGFYALYTLNKSSKAVRRLLR